MKRGQAGLIPTQRTRRARWLSLIVLCIAVSPAAFADRVQLANGDVVSGEIVAMDATTVTMETSFGTLRIPRDQVVRGEFEGNTDAGFPAGDETPAASASEYVPPIDPAAIDAEAIGEAALNAAGIRSLTLPDTQADLPESGDSASPPDDPLFHFALDGDFSDETGNYDLVNNGMFFASDRDGEARSALRSTGEGTYCSVAPDGALNALSAFTITFDVRLDETAGTRYLASKWTQAVGETADGKFTVQSSEGGITVFLVAPDQRYYWMSARGVLEAATWHSLAVRFGGGNGSIFVDGTAVYSRAFPFSQLAEDDSPLLIMTAEAATSDRFGYYNATGSVDDIRLYDRALSDEEILAIADSAR
jgi:hypothetical protein